MSVDPAKAQYTSVTDGISVYFCSKGCKEAYDSAPAAYGSAEGAHHG